MPLLAPMPLQPLRAPAVSYDDDYGYGTVTHEHRLWAYRLLLASLTGAHDAMQPTSDAPRHITDSDS